jgi:hypothetical protein
MGWHGVVGTCVPGVCITLPLTLTLTLPGWSHALAPLTLACLSGLCHLAVMNLYLSQ